MDINKAAEAVERFLASYEGANGRKALEIRSHPSGDDMDHIKVWVNLGAAAEGEDLHAWCVEAQKALRAKLTDELESWKLELRADAL